MRRHASTTLHVPKLISAAHPIPFPFSFPPQICICNDRSSQKMRSLVQYCLDLRYRRPTKGVIARRAVEIGRQEEMDVEANATEAMAESCGNDIRQVLNSLQMWSCKRCLSSVSQRSTWWLQSFGWFSGLMPFMILRGVRRLCPMRTFVTVHG